MATTSTARTTVVGVFNDHNQADQAVNDLRQAGFRDDQIGVAGRRPSDWKDETTSEEGGSHAGTGALAGALAGAGLGGLVGLGVLAGVIPVIGPVIAGGTLAALLANAAGGAAIGTLAGSLIGAGIPEEEANYYHSEFEAGRTIVTVHAGNRYEEASAILRRHGAYDMQTRGTAAATSQVSDTGQSLAAGATSGLTAGSHTTAATTGSGTASRTTAGSDRTIPVREEELSVQKHKEQAGEVHIRKDVVTEHKTMEVPVRREEVVVERHAPTGQHAATGPISESDQEIRVPVMEEQVSVEKHPVVKEEVSVRKQAVQDTEKVAADVKKEQVHVERRGDANVHETGKGGA